MKIKDNTAEFSEQMNGGNIFADRTVCLAAQKGLPRQDILKIAKILSAYPIACFDIPQAVFKGDSQLAALLPDSAVRVIVDAADLPDTAAAELPEGRLLLLNWAYCDAQGLAQLERAAKRFTGRAVSLAVTNADTLDCLQFRLLFDCLRRLQIDSLVYCCDGARDSIALRERMTRLIGLSPVPVEFYCGNQFGLASALSLAAVKAGVCRVSASVAGIGGFAPMEEVLFAAGQFCDRAKGRCTRLAPDFQHVLSLLAVGVQPQKALIGSDVFAHESGIHVDGIIKNPALYEVIRPEDVGLSRKLVIGKHSGTASLRIILLQHGLTLTQEEAAALLIYVRALAQRQKGPLSDAQLIDLYHAVVRRVRHECLQKCSKPI
jgi:homocitrate synthase NifV